MPRNPEYQKQQREHLTKNHRQWKRTREVNPTKYQEPVPQRFGAEYETQDELTTFNHIAESLYFTCLHLPKLADGEAPEDFYMENWLWHRLRNDGMNIHLFESNWSVTENGQKQPVHVIVQIYPLQHVASLSVIEQIGQSKQTIWQIDIGRANLHLLSGFDLGGMSQALLDLYAELKVVGSHEKRAREKTTTDGYARFSEVLNTVFQNKENLGSWMLHTVFHDTATPENRQMSLLKFNGTTVFYEVKAEYFGGKEDFVLTRYEQKQRADGSSHEEMSWSYPLKNDHGRVSILGSSECEIGETDSMDEAFDVLEELQHAVHQYE